MNKILGLAALSLGLAVAQTVLASEITNSGNGDFKDNTTYADSNNTITNVVKNDTGARTSTNTTTDSSTNVSVGDVWLALETNNVVSKAALANVSTSNVGLQAVKGGDGQINTSASLGSNANSGAVGISQVSVASGQNGVSQNAQVTANVRSLTLN